MSLVINKSGEENLVITLDGRLDTTTAPNLENLLNEILPKANELVFDFEKLAYISSAGLRVILSAQKTMSQKGKMKLIHVSSDVMEIFDMTGFTNFLTIE